MSEIDFIQHDLHDNDWLGIIVNNKDTLFSGRCQIRVYGLMDEIPDNMLPWAIPINSTVFAKDGAGSLSVPKIGNIVRVQFNNGDIYAPEYTTIQNIDDTLIQKIKDDYEGTHVLLYDPDEELSVIYQRKLGFQIFYKGSYLQITPDSMITIQHADQESVIQLDGDKCNIATKNEVNISASSRISITGDETITSGTQASKLGPGPYFHAVLGEILWPILQQLAINIDAKYPSTPGVNVGIVQSAKDAALSTNVLISK